MAVLDFILIWSQVLTICVSGLFKYLCDGITFCKGWQKSDMKCKGGMMYTLY